MKYPKAKFISQHAGRITNSVQSVGELLAMVEQSGGVAIFVGNGKYYRIQEIDLAQIPESHTNLLEEK